MLPRPSEKKATPRSSRLLRKFVVVERRLVLKEEIHLRRVRTTERYRETVTLREQHAVIERAAPGERKSDVTPSDSRRSHNPKHLKD